MIPLAIGAFAAVVALAPSAAMKTALFAPIAAAPIIWRIFGSATAWIVLFLACALLLPPLPFALGDTGPHPALVFIVLGGAIGIMRAREWDTQFDVVAIAAVSLFAVLLASVGLAAIYSGVPVALGSLARVLLFGIGVFVFLYVGYGPAHYSETNLRRTATLLFLAGCGSALFACVDFYFQFPAPAGYGPQFVWLDTGVFRRAQGVFYEASTLGNLCAFFLVMIAVLLFRRGGWLPCSRRLLVAGGVVFSAALIFSYSRASLLNVAAALCALAYLGRVRIRRAVFLITASAGAAALIVYAVAPEFVRNYWTRLSVTAEFFFSAPERVLSGRVASWQALSEFLMANPWHVFLGIGYKTLPYSDYTGKPIIADNMYVSLLVETGLLGLAAFAAFTFMALRASRRAAMSLDPRASFFGRWFFCFWIGQLVQMASGDLLTYWRVLPLYFWVLAIAVRNERSVSRSI